MHPLLYADFARDRQQALMADAQRFRLRRLLRRRRQLAAAAPVRHLPLRPASPSDVRPFPTDRKVA